MDIRCGMDIVELDRIAKALSRHGDKFKNKIFTEQERTYCESKGKASLQSYAARFCAKEAVSKALGTGISGGVSFLDIEILNKQNGKPLVFLYNEAKKIFEKIGGQTIDISLTHSRDYAAAQAVILTKRGVVHEKA
ncbi:MAG: holo-ACP synthase [Clostridiaceae bacterium]|nr:holo-ACP synthase [Clostridiaceae bacterium]